MEYYNSEGQIVELPEAGMDLFDAAGEPAKFEPPPAANQEHDEAIKKLNDEKADLEKEKSGIYGDLKRETGKRQELERRLDELDKKIADEKDQHDEDFGIPDDEEFSTNKSLRAFLTKLTKGLNKKDQDRAIRDASVRALDRVDLDEDRVMESIEVGRKGFETPWKEIVEEFKVLAQNDPSLWQQYDRLKYTPGGRPALWVYKTTIRESEKYQKKSNEKIRESLIDEIRENADKPIKLRGAGGREKELKDMTEEEIHNMSDDELDRATRG